MSVAYLEKLNPEQRRAVEHGVRENDAAPGTPLLVIAGAGSGKTNTLAHRVAHLIVSGPQNPADDLLAPGRRQDGAARRADRDRMLEKLGVSRATFYRWCELSPALSFAGLSTSYV